MTSSSSEKKDSVSAVISPIRSFTSNNLNTHEIVASITNPEGKKVNVTTDVDPAMKIALENRVNYDETKDKSLLKKIDFKLLPMLMLLEVAMYMDKSSLGNSAILGLKTDLGMVGDQYSWLTSAFYLGYLVFEIPSSLILQHFPLAKTMTCFVITWAVILLCHGAVKSYGALVVLRTLLGMLESSINPGMVMLTSQYYKKDEQFLRSTVWFSSSGIATILNACIGYSMVKYEDSYPIEPWRLNFYIIGAVSIVVGALFFFHVPDDPSKAWFLNDEEKARVVERLRVNQQGFGSKKVKGYQVKEAFTDLISWYYFWYGVSSDIPSGALGAFSSILLNDDFGYSTSQSMLMNIPYGALSFVGQIIFVLVCQKIWNSRMFISVASSFFVIIGSCMLAWPGGNKHVGLAGFYIQPFCGISMVQCLSCFSSNTGGATKKAVMDAIFLIGYCAGMIVGPQTFIDAQAPDYNGGKIAIVVSYSASMIFLFLIWWEYARRNKKNAKYLQEHPEIVSESKIENIEFADLTDKENPFFKYSY